MNLESQEELTQTTITRILGKLILYLRLTAEPRNLRKYLNLGG